MSKVDFDEYCAWLFPILQAVESRVDITHYSTLQKRIFGYMSERLLNVWVEAKKKKIISRPVIWFTDGDEPMKHYSAFSYLCRSILDKFSCLFAAHVNHDF